MLSQLTIIPAYLINQNPHTGHPKPAQRPELIAIGAPLRLDVHLGQLTAKCYHAIQFNTVASRLLDTHKDNISRQQQLEQL